MASALLGLSGLNKLFHSLEYFIHSSHMFVKEVLAVNFEEPVIPLIFLVIPMTSLKTLRQRFRIFTSFLSFLFTLISWCICLWLRERRVRSDVTYRVWLLIDQEASQNLIVWRFSLRLVVKREWKRQVSSCFEVVIAKVTRCHNVIYSLGKRLSINSIINAPFLISSSFILHHFDPSDLLLLFDSLNVRR